MGQQIASESGQHLAQFFPVATVAPIAKGAEPLVGMGLADSKRHIFNRLAARCAARGIHMGVPSVLDIPLLPVACVAFCPCR